MLSTISIAPNLKRSPWGRFGLVGISPLDHKVYLWQLYYAYDWEVNGIYPTQSKLVLWTVNPVVPSSWEELPIEIIVKKWIKVKDSQLSYCYSKILFRCDVYNDEIQVVEELIFVDLADGKTQSYPISTDFDSENVLFNKKVLTESFPQLRKPAILIMDDRPKTDITFMKDKVVYFVGTEKTYEEKLVAYDLKSDVMLEESLRTMTVANKNSGISPIGSPEAVYLAVNRTGFSTELFHVRMLDDRIVLNSIVQIRNASIGHDVHTIGDPATCGDGKVAVLHSIIDNCKLLTVVCAKVPTLKYMATWAVQQIFGTFGSMGEMVESIDENELTKMLGHQKKLF